MRVVLDTSVFVSGVFFGGVPGKVLEAWRDGRLEIVLSLEIVEEYVRVGEELSRRFPGVDLSPVLELLGVSALLVEAAPLGHRVCDDPDDDKFFACALAGEARYVVSGDRHLLDVSPHEGVEVLKPRELVERLLV